MKKLTVLSLVVAAGVARASFDLVLVADNVGTFNGPTPNKIHRYDGNSGVYMGAFNAGFSPIYDMAVNKAANELYAITSSNLVVYDYNLGYAKRTFSLSGHTALKFQNGNLYRATGSLLQSVNVNTGVTATLMSFGQPITDFAFAGSGGLMIYNSSSRVLQGFSSSFAPGTTQTMTNFSVGAVSRMARDLGSSSNVVLMGGTSFSASTTGQSIYSVSSAGALSLVQNSFYSSGFTNTLSDFDSAHSGAWIFGKNLAAANSLVRVDSTYGNSDTAFTTPQVTNAGPIAVVLAPEPGTFAAIGVGLAALLRRRKR